MNPSQNQVPPPVNQQHMQFGSGLFKGQAKYIDYAHMNQQEIQLNTLDEPITETLMRDLNMIFYKLAYVIIPRFSETQGRKLRNWDLWGPLLLSLLLAMTLGLNSNQSSDTIFGTIFIIMWGGSTVITYAYFYAPYINAKLLGGNVSFFQSVCVLGYCVFPINVAAIVIVLTQSYINFTIRLIICAAAFLWSSFSSLSFMGSLMNEEKKVISVYPIFLFYLFLAWFCLFI